MSSAASTASGGGPAFPPHVRLPQPGIPRRVSYVLPTPGSTASQPTRRPLKVYALPPALEQGQHRQHSGPILNPAPHADPSSIQLDDWVGAERHPKHSLAVTSLAIDSTTCIKNGQHPRSTSGHHESIPEGILYTAGRDGLICAWELGLPMRAAPTRPRKKRRRTTFFGRNEDDDDEDAEDEDDGHALSDRNDIDQAIDIELDRELSSSSKANGARDSPAALSDEVDDVDPTWEVDHARIAQTSGRRQTRFRQCLQSHTDWINDIILCNHNQTLISASSDRTVKIWNPHDPATSLLPSTFGSHSDYVRCLAHASDANAVISAGLDRTVKIWDLGLASTSGIRDVHTSDRPVWELSEQTIGQSVYALATTPAASMIAVGTPARTIRLWDPRARPQASPIANLIGHTDNVRALLISADGKHLLSGSSDSTIRLWSIPEQRCLHTFTHHNDSVWSLFSSDPNLDVFYSGDRRGYLCKVDLEGCGDIGEGECVVLAQVDSNAATSSAGGIQKIVALDNAFVWTAGGSSSVQMWRDVPSRLDRESHFPLTDPASDFAGTRSYNFTDGIPPSGTENFRRRYADSPSGSPRSPLASLPAGSPSAPKAVDLERSTTPRANSRSSPVPPEKRDWQALDVAQSMTMHGIPFDSLVSLAPANDPYGAAVGLGSTSIRDLPGALGRTSLSFINASRTSFAHFGRGPSISADASAYPGHPLALAPTRSRSILDGHTSPPTSGLAGSPSQAATLSGPHVSFQAGDPLKKDRSGSVIRFAAHVDTNEFPGQTVPEHAIDDGEVDAEEASQPDPAAEVRLAYEDREFAEEAKALRIKPAEIIEGSHGLIRCTMLNDRRHVLTVDSRGQLAIWDILAAQMLGIIDSADVREAAVKDEGCRTALAEKAQATTKKFAPQAIPAEILELVKGRLEGEGTCAPWCSVDVKTGALTVHLEEPRCFDAEIYLDECTDFVDPVLCQDDRRINMGKWVLRNLFDEFITAEVQMRIQEQPSLLTGVPAFENDALFQRRPSRNGSAARGAGEGLDGVVYTPGVTIPLAAAAKTPVLSRPVSRRSTVLQPLRTPAADQTPIGTSGVALDYFSIANTAPPPGDGRAQTPMEVVANNNATVATTPGRWGGKGLPALNTTHLSRSAVGSSSSDAPTTPSTPTAGFMGRLRAGLGNKAAKEKASKTAQPDKAETKGATEDEPAESSDPKDAPHVIAVRQLLARALNITTTDDFPVLGFDPEMSLIISEAVPNIGSWEVVYRGVVGCTGCDVSTLELTAPVWLLEFTLASRILARDQSANKLSFTLHPWIDPETDKAGGGWKPGRTSMPALPSGNVRLSATRMLRMRKVSMYVCEKLDLLPARKHADSIAGSIRSNAESGTKTPQGLNMTALTPSARNGGRSAANVARSVSSLSQTGSSMADEAAAAEHEQARVELARSIEILHGGIVLRPEITLAQCQRFYHRAGGDIKLEYRQRSPEAA
ncbi:hypothetical protein OC844_000686 [Tilletia horrida]|nr:hypothetical protein OC844_000686 [Tilletia horrida]